MSGPAGVGGHRVFVLIGAAFVLAVHVLLATQAGVVPARHVLIDTDAYMWLNRVLHLVGEGGWFDRVYPRINPPEGHVQHWTRPLDAFLVLGGAAAGIFVGFSEGLYRFSLAFPPAFHALTLVALAFAAKPLIERGAMGESRLPLLVLIALAQVPLYQPFLAGRPDHHAPLALLFALHLVFWIRLMLDTRGDLRAAMSLGAVNALALWVNPEALLYIALGMGGLLLVWIRDPRGQISRSHAWYGSTLLLGVVLALLAEWGGAVFRERWMDVLSLPHLGLFLAVAGFWWVLHGFSGRLQRMSSRVFFAAGASLATLAAVLVPFPEFIGDPLAATDPVYRVTRLQRIEELQPLWETGLGWRPNLGFVMLMAGTGFAAAAHQAWSVATVRDPRERFLYAVLLALLLAYLGLSFAQRRWTDYLALSTVVPMALLGSTLLTALEKRVTGARIRLVRIPVLLAVVLGHALLGLGLGGRAPDPVVGPAAMELLREWQASEDDRGSDLFEASADDFPSCDREAISRVLSDPEAFPEPQLVLAHTDMGPELLYRTGHSVLSVPNHRPQPGYHQMREILNHQDSQEASRLLHYRGVGVVVLCLTDVTSGFVGAEEGSFARTLVAGAVPGGFEWFDGGDGFRVYRSAR